MIEIVSPKKLSNVFEKNLVEFLFSIRRERKVLRLILRQNLRRMRRFYGKYSVNA